MSHEYFFVRTLRLTVANSGAGAAGSAGLTWLAGGPRDTCWSRGCCWRRRTLRTAATTAVGNVRNGSGKVVGARTRAARGPL